MIGDELIKLVLAARMAVNAYYNAREPEVEGYMQELDKVLDEDWSGFPSTDETNMSLIDRARFKVLEHKEAGEKARR